MQDNKSHVPVFVNAPECESTKSTVSLFVGSYEARYSTRKISDKIQNAKTSSKYKNDLP